MNNKTYGSRPVSRGYVNADGTVSRPKKQSGPSPSNAPQYKARAVYGAPPSPTVERIQAATYPVRGISPNSVPRQSVQMRSPQAPRSVQPPAKKSGDRSATHTGVRAPSPRPGIKTGQGRSVSQHPARKAQQNVPHVQKKETPSAGRRAEWIYPEGGSSDFERYYRQRRQAELQRARQRQEAARREAQRQKKLRRRKRAAQARGIMLRFSIVFLLVCAVTAWSYFSVYHGKPREKYGAVTYTMGKEDSFEASGSMAYYDGVLYVDFTRLASFLDMPMAGSIHYMRFIIPSAQNGDSAGDGTEEFVLFTVGSFTASINGVNMNMAGPCRLIDTAIWVPLSFVEHYMTGVTVKREKSDTVSLSRTALEGKENETEEITFRVKAQKPIDPVPYPEAGM